MSAFTPAIPNAAGRLELCPICSRTLLNPRKCKTLNDFVVCAKCRNGFANRRQAAYLIDALLFQAVATYLPILVYGLFQAPPASQPAAAGPAGTDVLGILLALAWPFIFVFKDGFKGKSPGRALFGVRVVDVHTREPVGFLQSMKRNLILMLPFLGVLLVIFTMMKGRRLGDRWARTVVIWDKHAFKPPFDPRGLLCTQCGYNLTGNVSGRCPECGTLIPARPDVRPALSGADGQRLVTPGSDR